MMIKLLICCFLVVSLSYRVRSAPQYDYDDEYDYSYYKTTPSPRYGGYNYRTTPSYGRYDYRTTPSPRYGGYNYEYEAEDELKERDYTDYYSPPTSQYSPPDLLGFLPTPVRDWFEKTVKQVEDMAHEIVKSKEKTVVEFIDKTMNEGETVVMKLLDDVINKTEDNKQEFLNTISDFHQKVYAIPQSVMNIWSRDEPLDAKEIVENQESLEDIKKKLNDFEKKVAEEIEKEKDLPFALRNQLVKFITRSRKMVKEMGKEEESFWNKLKLMEKEMYQFQLTVSEASEGLKDTLDSLFEALKKVDLPTLTSVKEGEKRLGEVDDFISRVLTD